MWRRFTPELHHRIGKGSPPEEIRGKIEAIRILKNVEDEGGEAMPDEGKILVKYVAGARPNRNWTGDV